jgi:hypothetical protein
MIFTLLLALKDWITWPVIVLVSIVVAICTKDQVRAAVRLKPFQFFLEAKNVRSKEERSGRM